MALSERAQATTAGDGAHTISHFVVAPIETAWRVFTDPAETKTWFGHPMSQLDDTLEADPPNYFLKRVDLPAFPGPTETRVTFEAVDGGTRITHSLEGIGEGLHWEGGVQKALWGVHEMMADMALYLRTGVGFPRHSFFPCMDLLNGTREVSAGLEVYGVQAGTLAAEVGLQPGDIVVALGGAGVYGVREVKFFDRSHSPGDVVEVKWIREGKFLTGQGHMTRVRPR